MINAIKNYMLDFGYTNEIIEKICNAYGVCDFTEETKYRKVISVADSTEENYTFAS